jgi:hypothetical protein
MFFKRLKPQAVVEGVKLKVHIARMLTRTIIQGGSDSGQRLRIEKPPVILRGRQKSIPARSNAEMEELLTKENLPQMWGSEGNGSS